MAMNRIALLMRNVAEIVHRIADHVHNAAERAFANRDGNGAAGIGGIHTADHAVGGQHRNRANTAFAEVLLHFRNYVDRIRDFEAVGGDSQRLINRRQIVLSKLNVDHRADDLHNSADVTVRRSAVRRSHIYSVKSFELKLKPYRSKTGRVLKKGEVSTGIRRAQSGTSSARSGRAMRSSVEENNTI